MELVSCYNSYPEPLYAKGRSLTDDMADIARGFQIYLTTAVFPTSTFWIVSLAKPLHYLDLSYYPKIITKEAKPV
jgi:hypothetical protein